MAFWFAEATDVASATSVVFMIVKSAVVKVVSSFVFRFDSHEF